jgi:Ras family
MSALPAVRVTAGSAGFRFTSCFFKISYIRIQLLYLPNLYAFVWCELSVAGVFNAVPIVLVGNKLDLADECRTVSTDDASRAAHARHCAFAETSAKSADLGQTVDAVIGQLLTHGFDVPLALHAVSSCDGSLTRATTSGGGSMKVTRGLSARRRLGRSRSAGIMSVSASGGGTSAELQDKEKTMQCRHMTNNVKQQQIQCRMPNNQTMSREAEELHDSRCVIL